MFAHSCTNLTSVNAPAAFGLLRQKELQTDAKNTLGSTRTGNAILLLAVDLWSNGCVDIVSEALEESCGPPVDAFRSTNVIDLEPALQPHVPSCVCHTSDVSRTALPFCCSLLMRIHTVL